MVVHGTSICAEKMFQGRPNSGIAEGSSPNELREGKPTKNKKMLPIMFVSIQQQC